MQAEVQMARPVQVVQVMPLRTQARVLSGNHFMQASLGLDANQVQMTDTVRIVRSCLL